MIIYNREEGELLLVAKFKYFISWFIVYYLV